MFREFSIALWLEVNYVLSGRLNKNIFVQTLTVVMYDGEPEDIQSIPLLAVLPALS
jgi:hypothetical protein